MKEGEGSRQVQRYRVQGKIQDQKKWYWRGQMRWRAQIFETQRTNCCNCSQMKSARWQKNQMRMQWEEKLEQKDNGD